MSVIAAAALGLAASPAPTPAPQMLAARAEPTLAVWHVPGPGPSVLYVHGATFPSALSVAYRIDGVSWLDDLRRRGFDVWTFDMAGYGASAHDAAFASEAPDAAPYGRAPAVARQIARVVDEIARKTGHRRVAIVAHSWGTIPAGLFAATHPERVERLALFGPIAPGIGSPAPAQKGAAVLVSRQDQWSGFAGGMPDGQPYLEPGQFDRWEADYLATDRGSAGRTPPAVRVPSGPMADIAAADTGAMPYALRDLRVPTLLIRGEWDPVSTADDLTRLARAMSGVPGGAKAVTLPRGGHRMHLERNRTALFDAVGAYLAQPAAASSPRK